MDDRAGTWGPFSLSVYSRLYPTCSLQDSQPSREEADADNHWSSSARHFSRPSWLAILQVSAHASLKTMHCDHVMEKLLSDWLKCILKLSHQGRALSLIQIERDTGQYGCRACVSIRNFQISWWKQVASSPKFYEECLRLCKAC